jgi:hypothetical protein
LPQKSIARNKEPAEKLAGAASVLRHAARLPFKMRTVRCELKSGRAILNLK